ncbi:Hyalin [Holothuria leucospilota]|uniref:Hyalin n=1 Tax=Holothuria leucospilota TaxID=206669 RepID=A0A9Q1CAW8_HOLLE|nr:Hyalin [Holothuria leucospilota]
MRSVRSLRQRPSDCELLHEAQSHFSFLGYIRIFTKDQKMERLKTFLILFIGIFGVCNAQLGRLCDDMVSQNCPFDPSNPGQRVPCYARPLAENAPSDEPNFVCDCTSLQRIDFDCSGFPLGNRDFITCYGIDCRSGFFESENYPNLYPDRWFATYLLYIPGASRIDFRFTGPGFGIESFKDELWVGTGLLYSFADIERANSSNLVEDDFELRFFDNRTLMGNMYPAAFSLSTDTVMLYFATDRNIRWAGFRLEWTAVVDDNPPTIIQCPMDITIQVQVGQQNSAQASWTPPTANDISLPVNTFSTHLPGDTFLVGQTEVIYTFRDRFENEANCSFFVNVVGIDTEPPVIDVCPNDIVRLIELGDPDPVIIWRVPMATDLGGDVTVFESHSSGSTFSPGMTMVNYVFTDAASNSAFCTFLVTINTEDTTPPDIMDCPGTISEIIELGTAGTVITWLEPTSSDISGTDTLISRSHLPGSEFSEENTFVEYIFGDASGNQAICRFLVQIRTVDTTPPAIIGCPSAITDTIQLGTAGTFIDWTAPTSFDVSNAVTVDESHNPGAFFIGGTTTVTYLFTDQTGNSALCSFCIELIIIDTEPPVISGCPQDQNLVVELGTTSRQAFWIVPTATDLSGSVELTTESHQSGDSFFLGMTTVMYAFSDPTGNTDVCTFVITVSTEDTVAPTIENCPGMIVETIELGLSGTIILWTEPTASDISGVAMQIERSHQPGQTFPIGVTSVTYRFSDNSDNVAVCSFLILIQTEDTTPPTISGCPNTIVEIVELGLPDVLVSYTEPTATDLSPPVILISNSHSPNTRFAVGTTTVTYIFQDNAQNQATCTFEVTVVEDDSTPPLVQCPMEISMTIQLGQSGVAVTYEQEAVFDASGTATLLSRSHASGDFFFVGTTIVVIEYIDASSNVGECMFNVIITTVDTEPPVISDCPDDQTVFIELGTPVGQAFWIPPTATDISGVANLVAQSHSPGNEFPIGSTTVTYLFGDESGNTALCVFVITIETVDTTPPVIMNCPEVDPVVVELGMQVGFAFWAEPMATDNSGIVSLQSRTNGPGESFPVGKTTVVYIFIDPAGLTSVCEFVICVNTEDTIPPEIMNCPVTIQETIELGLPGTIISWTEPTASDASGIAMVATRSHPPNSFFMVGNTEVTYTFVDGSGLTAVCSFMVVIVTEDTTPPTVLDCPLNLSPIIELGSSGDTVVWVEPTATDLSNTATLLSRSQAPGDFFPSGVKTTVTYVFLDQSGNTETCSFCIEFQFEDTVPPVISNCPVDQTVTVELGSATGRAFWMEPTATDISGEVSIVLLSNSPGDDFPIGPTTVTYIFSDESDNTATCTFIITVVTEDTTPPDISGCPVGQTVLIELGLMEGIAFWVLPTATDLSGVVTLETQTHNPGDSFMIGMTTVLYIFEDASGNAATCSFVVTVMTEDTTMPEITNCPTVIDELVECGLPGRNVEWTEPTASDLSGVAMLTTRSHAPNSFFMVGTTTVTYTFQDSSNNAAVCSFMVVVIEVDTTPPTIFDIPDPVIEIVELGTPGCLATWTAPTATDSCDDVMLASQTHMPGAFFPADSETTVCYTFIDENGNSEMGCFCVTCTSLDRTPPSIMNCPEDFELTIELGDAGSVAIWQEPTASDISGTAMLQSRSNIPNSFFQVGMTTVTYTFVDASRNVATCTFVITVTPEDTVPPTISNCPDDIVVTVELGQMGTTVSWEEPTATDISGFAMLSSRSRPPNDFFSLGPNQVTYVFIDASNNAATCTFTVTVNTIDTTPPDIMNCPQNQFETVELGVTSVIVVWVPPTATDISGTEELLSVSHTPGTSFSVGATVVTYEFTDSSGNIETCTFNVIVTTQDTTPPTIMGCPQGAGEVVELGTPGSLVSWVEPTASDLSPPVEVTVTMMPNTFFLVGTTEVVYTFRDNANNEATCTFNVVVTTIDTTPPTISGCPTVVLFEVELGMPGSFATWTEPTATDLSGSVVLVSATSTPGSFFPVGDTNVIYTFGDDSGNTEQCLFIVRVTTTDTTPPTIEGCPADIVEMIELGDPDPVVIWIEPTASDLSPTRILSQSSQPGMTFPIGQSTVTYIFTDTSDNTAICSFTITVVTIDTTPPVINNCPTNPSVTIELGNSEGFVSWIEPTATDLSGVANLDTRTQPPGSSFPVGQTTVMYVFVDNSGNAAVCQFVVIVNTEDTTAPTILNCPDPISMEIELGLPGTMVSWDEPMATDISGTQMLAMRSHEPGDFFPVGMTVVTYTFTDAAGNRAMCSFIIIIIQIDTLPPAITGCPGIDAPEITATIELGTSRAVVEFPLPSATDISQDVMVFSNCASGDSYPVGVTDCIFTFTDSSGNSAPCAFTIEVLTEDTTPPTVIQCPTSDVTAIVELGTGSTVVTYPEPLATDNSQSTMLLQSQTCTSGESYNVGTTMCVYLFVDPTGNSSPCTFNVVVSTVDTTPPTISNCPTEASTTVELGILEGSVIWVEPTATDLSGTAVPSSTHQPGQLFPLGVTVVTYTFTDSSQNQDTCTFSVTVSTVDTTPPNIIDCPFPIVETIELGLPGAIVSWQEPSATDISGTVNLISRSNGPTDLFLVGATTVTYLFSDPTGNSAECIFCVTINTEDTTPPTIANCPPDQAVTVELGLLSGTATWIVPTASDESGVAQIISQSNSPGDSFPLGSSMVTYTFTDASGNTAMCSFTVTVETEDTTPPVCTNLPEEISECVELGLAGANVELPQPTCVDISNTGMVSSSSHVSGAFFIVGETAVTYICSDESGNNAQCRLTVNVVTKDTTPPDIMGCPVDQTVTIELGLPSGPAFWVIPTATDISGEVSLITQTNMPGDSFTIGMTTVLYIFEDSSGNTETCSFVVTVITEDTTPPTIMDCPDRIQNVIELGLPGLIVSWTEPSASDISGVAMVSMRSHAPNTLFDVGVTTVTYTFTDNSNNVAVCTFMVIITTEDTTPPTCVNVPDDIREEVELGQFGTVLSWTPPTCDDISGTGQITATTHTPPSFFMVGMATVIYTCTDDSGNSNQCPFNVEVISVDTLPPAITGCPGIDAPPIVLTIELGTPTAVVDFSEPSASDLSGDVVVSSDCQSGDNYPVGVTNCVFIFSDSSGNSAQCPFTIEVLTEDTTPPTILNCPPPGSVTAVVELGITSAIVTYQEPIATDNSQSQMLLQSQTCTSGNSYNVGVTMCLYLFVDPSGNTSPCSFSVTVTTIDTTPPTVANCPQEASAVVELGLSQGAVFYTVPSATDLSGDVTVASTSDPGQLLPLGSTVITYTFTDSSGNEAFCIFEATVVTVDTTPPSINACPADIVVVIELGLPGTVVSWIEPTASDISGTASIVTRSNTPNELFLVGPTTVTYLFSDSSGNTAECRFCVTVDTEDTQPPIISNCPNDVTVIVELGLATSGIATWTPPTATDVSGFAQITSESNRPGDSFPLGPTTVTYIFTDLSGNSATCSFIVTVDTEDTTPPTVIGCPTEPVTVTVELGTPSAIVTYQEPFATDNSQSQMLLQSQTCTSGTSYDVGETMCLYLFVDPSGNSSPCTFTVVVQTVDTTPPTISNCPTEASTVVELGITRGFVIWIEPTATDLSGSVTTSSNRQPGEIFNLGDTVITYTFTDASGNENTCVFVATVNTEDTTPPTITGCPADVVEVIELGLPGAVINWIEPSASDISGTVNLIERSHAPTDILLVGQTIVTYVFSDPSGNMETCSFTVTIVTEDTTPPTISNWPSDQTIVVELGVTSGVAVWTPPTATDLSGVAQIVSQTHTPGDSFPLGSTTVTYTYADASGNTDTCFFTVTVIAVDTTPPMCANLPQEVSECIELGMPGTNVELPEPTCVDISNTGMVSARSHQSGAFFLVGDTTVTYTCSDESGNSEDCTLTVRVVTKDTTPPDITGCPQDQVVTIELGLPSGIAVWVEPSASDLSGVASLITRTNAPGDDFMVGMTTVVYIFQDSSNNDATCSFVVTVVTEDTTPPTIMDCPATIPNVVELGTSGLIVPWTEPTASDISGVAMLSTRTHPPNSFFPVGVTTVTYTFTDSSDNPAVCTFMIIITTEDTTPPTCVNVPDDIREEVELGQFGTVLSWTPPTCDDISGTGQITATTHTPPSFFMVGTATVIYTCTDDSGNSNQCTFNVEVVSIDTTPPAITGCPSDDAPDVSSVVELGITSSMITYVEPSATDLSDSVIVSSNCVSGQPFPVGETMCTYTFVDNSGNSIQCAFTVTVTTIDTTPPDITGCPTGVSVEIELGEPGGVAFWVEPTASDICGEAPLTSRSHGPGNTFDVGVTMVTYIFTDCSSNNNVCTFPVTVTTIDTTPPTITGCPSNIEETFELGNTITGIFWIEPTASDISGVAQLTSRSQAPGSVFQEGVTVVTYMFTDLSGNVETCTFTVTIIIEDTTPPVITCPPDVEVIVSLFAGSGTATFLDATATDASNSVVVSCDALSGASYPTGTTVVTCTAIDNSANSAQCTFNIDIVEGKNTFTFFTILDDIDPVVTCPVGPTVTVIDGQEGVCVDFANPTATDNSGTTNIVSISPESGSYFLVGVTTVTAVVSDPSGNTASCSFAVTVIEANPCDPNPCQNGAFCVIDSLTAFTCVCPDCFQGTFCEIDIDACDGNLCQNGAACVEVDGSCTLYTCECPPCFSGEFCENFQDACLNNDCQNGGSCVQDQSCVSYTCRCPACFEGALCQTAINPCEFNTCANGAQCIPDTLEDCAGFACICTGCFTGFQCNIEIDPCSPSPCQNGAQCFRDAINCYQYTCECQGCFHGPNCEAAIPDPCIFNPCENGGLCTRLTTTCNAYRCSCPNGFGGFNCQDSLVINRDPCNSFPCESGGTCLETSTGGYVCMCRDGYAGINCDQFTGSLPVLQFACSSNPCTNGGTCRNSYNSASDNVNYEPQYTCICPSGFSGSNCQIPTVVNPQLNVCSGGRCQNGGECFNTYESFTQAVLYSCSCPVGFIGQDCDISADNPCDSSPCQNGAFCAPFNTYFMCSCIDGFTGTFCQLPPDSGRPFVLNCPTEEITITTQGNTATASWTEPVAIINGQQVAATFQSHIPGQSFIVGTTPVTYVFSTLNSQFAECLFFVTVKSSTDRCSPQPCLNGGRCLQTGGQLCDCTGTGFRGMFCELMISNGCQPNPCENGGTCSPTPSGFNCLCVAGFGDLTCAVEITPLPSISNGLILSQNYPSPYPDGLQEELIIQSPNENFILRITLFILNLRPGDVLSYGSGTVIGENVLQTFDGNQNAQQGLQSFADGNSVWITFTSNNDGQSGNGYVLRIEEVSSRGKRDVEFDQFFQHEGEECPCQNGGSCLNVEGLGKYCLCPEEFQGVFCEVPKETTSTQEIISYQQLPIIAMVIVLVMIACILAILTCMVARQFSSLPRQNDRQKLIAG